MLEEIIMAIFALLPTKALVRCKAVCRTWEKLIANPFFTQDAYSRVPYTIFFTITSDPSSVNKVQGIVPMHEKTNNCTVDRLLSKKFKVLASSNGVLCLCRDQVLLVGNPITSFWAEIPKLNPSPEPYQFAGATMLFFNPASSLDFNLLFPVICQSEDTNTIYDLRFHVFSSETCYWTLSSTITLKWDDDRPYDARLNRFVAVGLRRGSVCWMQGDDFLMGYEINSNAYWKIPLPKLTGKGIANKWIVSGYDGGIYHLVVMDVKLTIWRLEGSENWVREGEWKSEGFKRFVLVPFAIDQKRGMLFIKGRFSNELAAFHLANSRWEIICQDASIVSVFRIIPYVASDVSFAGGLEGGDAIDRVLRERSKAPLEIN